MVEVTATIVNPSGLHARPAAEFVKAAAGYQGTTIKVIKDGREAEAKSILAIMALGIRQGHTVRLRAEGPQEREAVEMLARLLASGFGEV